MAGGKVPRLLRPGALWTLRRCELCDNHLSTESTVQPGQLPGTARTGYSYLGLYPGTQHQPQPHNPTWNSKSSQEKVLYRILFSYLQILYGRFLLIQTIPVGGPLATSSSSSKPQPENSKLDPELSGQKTACACSLAGTTLSPFFSCH